MCRDCWDAIGLQRERKSAEARNRLVLYYLWMSLCEPWLLGPQSGSSFHPTSQALLSLEGGSWSECEMSSNFQIIDHSKQEHFSAQNKPLDSPLEFYITGRTATDNLVHSFNLWGGRCWQEWYVYCMDELSEFLHEMNGGLNGIGSLPRHCSPPHPLSEQHSSLSPALCLTC